VKKKNALSYFVGENENIGVYIVRALKMEEMLRNTRELTRAAILYHSAVTGIRYVSELPPKTSLFDTEKHIYGAFIHYCNFDTDLPIPDDLISVCNSKPVIGYDRNGTMEEKKTWWERRGWIAVGGGVVLLLIIASVSGDQNSPTTPPAAPTPPGTPTPATRTRASRCTPLLATCSPPLMVSPCRK
jgi:hypothetical protein